MAGGQTEQKIDTGVARRTEGLPGIRGQVRHLVEAKVGCLAVSAPHRPKDGLLCWARRFVQQGFAHIGSR